MIGAPVHRFARNPNFHSHIYQRVMNRASPFESTLTILNDPKNSRQLYLIGTTNSSTTLAGRTRDLIREIKPDTVFVQTNEKWFKLVSLLDNIKTQKDLNLYSSFLTSAYDFYHENNLRGLIFKMKLYPFLFAMKNILRLPSDFHPFTPGLEMKYAIEEAQKADAELLYGGLEIDAETMYALKVEPRMDLIPLLYRAFYSLHNKLWKTEFQDNFRLLKVQGGETFAELMDRYRTNWFVKLFEKYAPHQKRIFIDQKDVDLFHNLYRAKGKTMVAVVNQWHMTGIEAHWRHTTGTEVYGEPINPIGDMNIEQYMEGSLVNDKLREITSAITGSEPATWQNYITQYHKETQEAHRTRHVYFLGYDDPNVHHGLFGHSEVHWENLVQSKEFAIQPHHSHSGTIIHGADVSDSEETVVGNWKGEKEKH